MLREGGRGDAASTDLIRCSTARTAFKILSFREIVCPFIDVLLRLLLGDAIPLLNLANQLLSFALDLIEVVVGQVAPFLFDLSLKLFPLSGNLIPIHNITSCLLVLERQIKSVENSVSPDQDEQTQGANWNHNEANGNIIDNFLIHRAKAQMGGVFFRYRCTHVKLRTRTH